MVAWVTRLALEVGLNAVDGILRSRQRMLATRTQQQCRRQFEWQQRRAQLPERGLEVPLQKLCNRQVVANLSRLESLRHRLSQRRLGPAKLFELQVREALPSKQAGIARGSRQPLIHKLFQGIPCIQPAGFA
jgi:hypothetical protein